MTVKITKDNLAKIAKNIDRLPKKYVVVGIPASEDSRQDGTINNAALGHIHENGSPVRNIPPRPTLVPGVRSVAGQCAAILRSGLEVGLTEPEKVEGSLNKAGLVAQTAVKKRITSSEGLQPLAAETIRARQRKGAMGERPLLRTGQFLNAFTYEIRKK